MKTLLAALAIVIALQGCSNSTDGSVNCHTENLLLDGDFSGDHSVWTQQGPIIDTQYEWASFINLLQSQEHSLSQIVTVPEGTEDLRISGMRNFGTKGDPAVTFDIKINDNGTNETVAALTGADIPGFGFQPFEYVVMNNYSTKTITIEFKAVSPAGSLDSIFAIDDLSLDAEVCL